MSASLLLGIAMAGLASNLLTNLAYLARTRRRPRSRAPHPSVSVLVPARNEAVNLRSLLPSLLTQRYPAFEIIVYDDESDDDTWSVLQAVADARLRAIKGCGPPAGWVGKVHALAQATQHATGEWFLFLDADARLKDPGALERLVDRARALPAPAALSGITDLRGSGLLLVSMVPFAILTFLPIPLIQVLRSRLLSGMNGQCWLIARDDYRRLQPHRALRAEVLEDVRIGQFLKARGVAPYLHDLRSEVAVHMYDSLREAWAGFRKNAYPFMGDHPVRFFATHAIYVILFVVAPAFSLWFLLAWYAMKAASDRYVGMPWRITAAAPASLVLWAALQLDSAVAHWTGRVRWKGRPVARRSLAPHGTGC